MGKISHEFTVQCGKTEPTTSIPNLRGESNPNFKMPSSKYVRVERRLLESTPTIPMEKPYYTFLSSTNSYYMRTAQNSKAQRVERKPLFLLCLLTHFLSRRASILILLSFLCPRRNFPWVLKPTEIIPFFFLHRLWYQYCSAASSH